jgi:hypothetical protein
MLQIYFYDLFNDAISKLASDDLMTGNNDATSVEKTGPGLI